MRCASWAPKVRHQPTSLRFHSCDFVHSSALTIIVANTVVNQLRWIDAWCLQEGDPAPKFDKKPKTDELMEAIRFKGRQYSQGCAQHSHAHSSHELDACSAPYLEKKNAQGRVCMQAWPWSPFDEMDAYQGGGGGGGAAAEPEESATAALPSPRLLLRSTDWGVSGVSCAGGQASVIWHCRPSSPSACQTSPCFVVSANEGQSRDGCG